MLFAVALPGRCSTMCKVLFSSLLFLPCSHFFLLHLFGCPSGCSPDSSTASRRSHVWSAVHTDHHAFFHHVKCLFDTSFFSCIEFFLLGFNAFLLRCHLFCFLSRLLRSPLFLTRLLRSPVLLSRLLRSPLFVLTRLLRSLFFLFFLYVFFLL